MRWKTIGLTLVQMVSALSYESQNKVRLRRDAPAFRKGRILFELSVVDREQVVQRSFDGLPILMFPRFDKTLCAACNVCTLYTRNMKSVSDESLYFTM